MDYAASAAKRAKYTDEVIEHYSGGSDEEEQYSDDIGREYEQVWHFAQTQKKKMPQQKLTNLPQHVSFRMTTKIIVHQVCEDTCGLQIISISSLGFQKRPLFGSLFFFLFFFQAFRKPLWH
jgi:hypothetical protein